MEVIVIRIFKKIRIVIIIIILLSIIIEPIFFTYHYPTKQVMAKNLSNEQWIEDIDYLKESLPKLHKNLYHSIKKEDFNQKMLELRNNIPTLDDSQIRIRLAQIIAMIGDAHTSLYFYLNDSNPFYPLGLDWYGNDLRVLATDTKHKDLIGKKLISINTVPIDKIIEKVNTLISHENEQWLKTRNVEYVIMPEILRYFHITAEDKAKFEFMDGDGEITQMVLTPGNFTNKDLVRAINLLSAKPIAYQNLSEDFYKQLYWYQFIPEDKILYFQYNRCIDKNTAKMRGYKTYQRYPDFNDFSDELISEINHHDVKKLIIDLRNNEGGTSSLMTSLAYKLRKIDKLKGRIYVIIGKKTFSSGVLAVLDLKKITNAIVYGEPTGGDVNGYGDIKALTLPHSKLQMTYSTKYFLFDNKYKEGFEPDIPVEQSYNHFIDGIDDVYEAIRAIQ